MARITTLQDRVRQIIRQYAHVNNHRYLYNKKSELKGRFTHVKCWFLIHDSERGYSIFPFTFKRKAMFTIPQWTRLFKSVVGEYQPLISIFTQAVLPAINNKGGSNWRFKSLLCWTGITMDNRDALSKTKNTAKRRRRNTTTKKRHANARSRNRSR